MAAQAEAASDRPHDRSLRTTRNRLLEVGTAKHREREKPDEEHDERNTPSREVALAESFEHRVCLACAGRPSDIRQRRCCQQLPGPYQPTGQGSRGRHRGASRRRVRPHVRVLRASHPGSHGDHDGEEDQECGVADRQTIISPGQRSCPCQRYVPPKPRAKWARSPAPAPALQSRYLPRHRSLWFLSPCPTRPALPRQQHHRPT